MAAVKRSVEGSGMSKEKGQQNRDKFRGWVAKMKAKNPPNWLDYWHSDKLSPKKIAGELGFDSSAFKKSRNRKLFDMLQALQQELAADGIYHKRDTKLPLESVDAIGAADTATDQDDIKDSAKVRDLKRANRRLQAENAKLAAEVGKLSEFKEVLIEIGLWK